ncbi:predicted protein [Coccidioides posadasii str. Silveira]|uniref:Predicted protein n=1 Tax=Coccidioides posadasii (strain RMSCC 757 / Silveira) TaxID=443226 RepID=E9CUG1_COCPS|nr:predicted protein [Coccidioides posadasii str. Silveira]
MAWLNYIRNYVVWRIHSFHCWVSVLFEFEWQGTQGKLQGRNLRPGNYAVYRVKST